MTHEIKKVGKELQENSVWGWKISTNDGITVVMNQKGGCLAIRNETLKVIDMLMTAHPERKITIEWQSPVME